MVLYRILMSHYFIYFKTNFFTIRLLTIVCRTVLTYNDMFFMFGLLAVLWCIFTIVFVFSVQVHIPVYVGMCGFNCLTCFCQITFFACVVCVRTEEKVEI